MSDAKRVMIFKLEFELLLDARRLERRAWRLAYGRVYFFHYNSYIPFLNKLQGLAVETVLYYLYFHQNT
jgi:hypothetical protein